MEAETGRSRSEAVYQFFYTLFKRKYLAAIIFFSTLLGIVFGTFLVIPLWKASAKVRVQYSPKQQLTMLEGITTPGTVVPGVNPANDVVQILRSRELAEKIVGQFDRDGLWETRRNEPQTRREKLVQFFRDTLNPFVFLQKLKILPVSKKSYLAMAVKEFQNDLLDVSLEEETTVVTISVWGESPEAATDMCNALVDLMIAKNLEFSLIPVEVAIGSTEKQLAEAERNLKDAQQNLRAFKEKTGFVLYEEEAKILLERLDIYETQRRTMETQLISLRIEKNPDHPEVKSLESSIEQYRQKVIPEIRGALSLLAVQEVEYSKLSQELEAREHLFNLLKEKLLELVVLRDSSVGDLEIKIIDYANVYSFTRADWPKTTVNFVLGLVFSAIVSLFIIFFVEYWTTSYKSVRNLEADVDFPVLGSIPRLKSIDRKRILTWAKMPQRIEIRKSDESQRSNPALPTAVADEILMNRDKSDEKVWLVTSPDQGEGKSLTTVLLARALSLRGKKVLIIEANYRFPSLARMLGITKQRRQEMKGLLEVIDGSAEAGEVIVNFNGIDVMAVGDSYVPNEDVVDSLSSQGFQRLLEGFRKTYDFVLLDTPFIKRFKDTLVLVSKVDSVVLVVEANRTPKRTIHMALTRINDFGGQIKGLVLNKQIDYVPEFIQSLISSI